VNAVNYDHTTILNAIVFSNFPDVIFDNEIRDKLTRHHVNVVQVYKPDRVDAAVADVSQADAVISFIDFMSHSQDELIRKRARAWGKPIASLRRQSSDWSKLLADVMPKPKPERMDNEAGSSPESLPSHVKQSMNTFMSLTISGVGEDDILQAMRTTSDIKDLAQVEDMFERYVKTDCAPMEFRIWWREHQKAKPLPPPPASEPSRKLLLTPLSVPPSQSRRSLSSLKRRPAKPPVDDSIVDAQEDEDVTVLKKKLKEAEEMGLLFEEENRRMQTELRSIVDKKVRSEVEQHILEWTKKVQQLEKDNAALSGERTTLQANLKMLIEERLALTNEKRVLLSENEELRKSAPEVESLKGQLETAEKKLEAALKQFASLETDCLAEKTAREAAEKKLANNDDATRDLDTIAASFKNLHKLGFLTRADIAERLVSQVLGDGAK
jgi:hypothetical protein